MKKAALHLSANVSLCKAVAAAADLAQRERTRCSHPHTHTRERVFSLCCASRENLSCKNTVSYIECLCVLGRAVVAFLLSVQAAAAAGAAARRKCVRPLGRPSVRFGRRSATISMGKHPSQSPDVSLFFLNVSFFFFFFQISLLLRMGFQAFDGEKIGLEKKGQSISISHLSDSLFIPEQKVSTPNQWQSIYCLRSIWTCISYQMNSMAIYQKRKFIPFDVVFLLNLPEWTLIDSAFSGQYVFEKDIKKFHIQPSPGGKLPQSAQYCLGSDFCYYTVSQSQSATQMNQL